MKWDTIWRHHIIYPISSASHYSDIMKGTMASQFTAVPSVHSIVCSKEDKVKVTNLKNSPKFQIFETGVVDLGQVGRWERGTHQPRSGGESRRAVTWSDPSFPNPRTVSTVVESLLIILCLYCIYKCIRRPHNIWRCRTGFLPCARTVLVRCFVYFDNFSEVNFCVLCCSVREHTFGFDSCGVVGPRVSGMWTV